MDSTVAYQVGGRGFDAQLIDTLNQFSTKGFNPELTFLLDVSYQIGIKRATRFEVDRFEEEKGVFFE